MGRVRNEEVHRKAEIEREVESRGHQSIEMVWTNGGNG